HVVGRMESAWRAASPEESFEIVRRRLFEPLLPEGEKRRDEVVRAFRELYRANAADFPSECRDAAYVKRFEAAYPIHPELFDRLYNDWSTLDRFQRTRGVLRLMAAVIHALWARNDQAPLILPASIPLDDTVVRTELIRHLDENWAPILDSDIDGAASLSVRLDSEVTTLGRYAAARRVARTVFLGSAPTLRSANQGLEVSRVRLGCAMPGETVATFGDALNRLSGRATYLYASGGRYWYGTQPGVTRLAAELAERLLTHDRDAVHHEIERRLHETDRGAFAAVHVAPRSAADVPDDAEVRLVVLAPTDPHIARSEESAALDAARKLLDQRGNAARERRNMLIFLAADHRRAEDLESAAADFLAWQRIEDDARAERINLDAAQARQAKQQRDDADRNLVLRLAETYHWALAPTQPDPTGPVTWEATKIEGQGGLAARTSRKLVAEGALYEQFAPALLRMQLSGPLARLWEPGHVSATALWDAFSRYCYLPRIASARVLYDAVAAGPASTDWARDAFATADAYDESTGRYAGLVTGGFGSTAPTTLVVRPDVATRQVEADRAADDARADDAAQDGSSGAATDEGDGATSTKQDGPSAGPATPAPVSFYGVAILDSERPTKSFGKIHEEVVQPLVALLGTEVEVTVEVRAKNPSGFPPTVVRTVTENARALRLEPYEFGES
ncbi:MAG: ATP-binding protein, partial [Actinomycetes bacterium]